MKIKTFLNNMPIYMDSKKLNIIYGAAQSGKTTLLQNLNSGFQGKLNVSFLLNNTAVSKSDFEVFYLDYKNDLLDQFKLGNKSYLRTKLLDSFLTDLDRYNKFENQISEFLKDISTTFDTMLNERLKISEIINTSFDIKNLNEIFLQTIQFKINDYDSTSETIAKFLFLLIVLDSISLKKTILLIDNFDNALDETYILKFISYLKNYSLSGNITIFLSSNKSLSYPYVIDDFSIYYMNAFKIKEIPSIDYFLREYYVNQNISDNLSFEDYIIQSELFLTKEDLKYSKDKLKTSIHYNIARMLVNNDFEISNTFNNHKITIYYDTEIEKNILLKIQKFLIEDIIL